MPLVTYGIAVLPDAHAKHSIINMSTKIASIIPLRFQLGDSKNLPHLTLYQSVFDEEQTEELKKELDRISIPLFLFVSLFAFEPRHIAIFSSSFIFLDVALNDNLYGVHYGTLERFRHLRAKNNAPAQELRGLTEAEIENIRWYGSPFCRKEFRPHITLGRAESPISDEQLANIRSACCMPSPFMCPPELVLYRAGVDGECLEILHGSPLK